jgi:hypothetical protein
MSNISEPDESAQKPRKPLPAAESVADREPWQFVRIVRQPSGFGVAYLTIRHRDKGSVAVPMTAGELLHLAQDALAAMEPGEHSDGPSGAQ